MLSRRSPANARLRGRDVSRRGGVKGLLGGVVKPYIRMDSSKWDPILVGAVRNSKTQTHHVSWPLDRQLRAEFLVQRRPFLAVVGSGLGGASPHPTAVGPNGLEPPGTAIGSGWPEDSWGIPVSSDGVCG